MKFKIGSEIDHEHCIALQHEFLRCDDAFKEFKTYATIMIMKGKNNWISYKAYNAYADFVHHLYEFLLGCCVRDIQDTQITNSNKERVEFAGKYISSHVNRILTNRREDILRGTAPAWENDISYYPERVPDEFADEFRKFRNTVSGHVKYQRAYEMNLSDFYNKYHKYLYMLYQESLYWWENRKEDFPNLEEITKFSILIENENS